LICRVDAFGLFCSIRYRLFGDLFRRRCVAVTSSQRHERHDCKRDTYSPAAENGGEQIWDARLTGGELVQKDLRRGHTSKPETDRQLNVRAAESHHGCTK